MKHPAYVVNLLARKIFSDKAFEIELTRPAGFYFTPGQFIRFAFGGSEREYSIASGENDPTLKLCVRDTKTDNFSSRLAVSAPGTPFEFTGPHGYFAFQPSENPAIWVATGTGIAPFTSMVRSGITGFTMLHGVERAEDLYYKAIIRSAAGRYISCLSKTAEGSGLTDAFSGRVTVCIEKELPAGKYDFYLCGRREMVRDVMFLADRRFPDSRIYSEVFY